MSEKDKDTQAAPAKTPLGPCCEAETFAVMPMQVTQTDGEVRNATLFVFKMGDGELRVALDATLADVFAQLQAWSKDIREKGATAPCLRVALEKEEGGVVAYVQP